MLEIRSRRRQSAERRRVEQPAPRSQEAEAHHAARDLEAAARNVLMRDAVAEKMRGRAEQQRAHARAGEGTDGGAGGNVEETITTACA